MNGAKLHQLENGLRIVTVPMDGLSSVTVMAMVGVGSRYETPEMNGISHFLEHMVFKGSKKWPTAHALSSAIDGIGADFNAFTGKEYTGFYVKAASRHMELAVEVVSDMLYSSKLRSEDIEREKGVICEEINMYNDLPQRKVAELFDRAMYGDVGLGRRIDGTHEVVKSFTRVDFVRHMKTWYGLDNSVVVVAGNKKSVDRSLPLVTDLFSVGEKFGRTTEEKVLGFEDHGDIQLTVKSKKSDQAHLALGFPSYSMQDKDRYVLSVLATILGGNMSSRLFTEVREKRGLAYYARIDVDRFQDTGSMSAVEGVDVNRVDEAVKVTLQVFTDVSKDGKKGVTEEELARAKEYLSGSLLLSMEGSRNTAQYWAQRVVLGDEVIGPEEVLKRVRAVSREDVVRVARDVINPEKLVFSLVGPFEDGGKFERLLRV